jgi:hypothetical protein
MVEAVEASIQAFDLCAEDKSLMVLVLLSGFPLLVLLEIALNSQEEVLSQTLCAPSKIRETLV